MNAKLLSCIGALGAAAGLVPASAGLAQTAPTTVPSLKLVGAYAVKDTRINPGRTTIATVFRTASELPRRYDGMIRASGFLDGVGHSVGSVKGRHGTSRHCYVIYTNVVDGHLPGGGSSARLGTRHTLEVAARGTDGDLVAKTQVHIRAQRAGDASGRPLGC
ncbi:hypothetical protein FSW04_07065 [Baekduia soli]|uniref:DUF3224 domain-containing protein n=1 Tax=Baekduia soli TaxID=496014 RepID=A0A5B8U3F1_9ACTN|nr:hypothetical protein [Baekduia soli]QEC47365.1 hypothetical protein FSW04_07065 [Baekduia soli]